jgi:hypothetical protein
VLAEDSFSAHISPTAGSRTKFKEDWVYPIETTQKELEKQSFLDFNLGCLHPVACVISYDIV